MKILYTENGKAYCRNDKGQIQAINAPKFKDKQIVLCLRNNEIQQINGNPRYSDNKWWYGILYIDLQGSHGGGSYSWAESDFEEIKNPSLKLMVERLERLFSIQDLKRQLEQKQNELKSIEYSLSICLPDFKEKKGYNI